MNLRTAHATMTLMALLMGVTGCVGQMGLVETDGPSGEVRLALSARAGNGTEYRLRNAIFTADGPDYRVISADDDAPEGATAVSATLRAGTYQILLERGWTLDRIEPDGTSVRVTAELVGDNPIAVTVRADARANARFRFFIPADGMVETDTGDLDVGFDVEEESCPAWYSDCDGDGFAPAGATAITQCGTPTGGCGWTVSAPVDELSTDCNDDDARARPLALSYYATAQSNGRFDYDCNGSEDLRHPRMIDTTQSCRGFCIGGFGCSCSGPSGWTTRIPPCGERASWGYCSRSGGSCRFTAEYRTQDCR